MNVLPDHGLRDVVVRGGVSLTESAALIQRVLARPPKRRDHAEVNYLNAEQTRALLAEPDRST